MGAVRIFVYVSVLKILNIIKLTIMFFIAALTPSKWIVIIIIIRHYYPKNNKQMNIFSQAKEK